MHVSDTNTVGADFQVMIQLIETIGTSANVNVIACAWDCAAHCLTIWFFEVRLETSTSPRSTNVTFGDDSPVNGPFSKDSDRINIGQAYLGYKGFRDFTFTGGRFAVPFVNTSLLWDDDINVEGLAEQWKHSFVFGGEPPPPPSFSKDGKAVVASKPPEPFLKLDIFANFGQFVYDDDNPENPIGPRATTTQPITGETQLTPNNDAFLLGWQVAGEI